MAPARIHFKTGISQVISYHSVAAKLLIQVKTKQVNFKAANLSLVSTQIRDLEINKEKDSIQTGL